MIYSLRSLGSLEEDEQRAHEQLEEIKTILRKAKERIESYMRLLVKSMN